MSGAYKRAGERRAKRKGKGAKSRAGGGGGYTASPSTPTLGQRALALAPIALGLLFLVAGISKAFDPHSFRAALGSYGLPEALRPPVAYVLPTVEILVALMLLLGWARKLAAQVAVAMLAVFVVSIAYGWSLGTLEECACFGALIERSPEEAMVIDLVFLALAVAVWRAPTRKPLPMDSWRPLVLGFVGLLGLALTSAMMTAGPSGLGAVAAGGGLDFREVDLSVGEHLVYMFHYECPHCADMSPRVAEYTRDPALPPVVGLTYLTPQSEIDRYREQYDLRIPIQVLAPQAFSSVTGEGSVPQLLFVRDGEIVRTWLGLLPLPDELRRSLSER